MDDNAPSMLVVEEDDADPDAIVWVLQRAHPHARVDHLRDADAVVPWLLQAVTIPG